MSDDQDKNRPKFTLTPPPPPPPSIEEITRRMQGESSGQWRPPPEPPAIQAATQGAYAPDTAAASPQQQDQQLSQALEQARQVIAAKDAEIANFNASFKEIQVQLGEVGDIIKSKDSEIEGLRSRLDALTAELKGKDGEAFRLKAKNDLLEETVSKSKRDLLVYQRKAEGYQKECEKANELVKAETAEKAELQAKIEALAKESQAKIDEQEKKAQAEEEALQAEIERLKGQISEHEAAVKEKEMEMLTIKDEMATLKDKLVVEIESKQALESKISSTSMRLVLGGDAIIEVFNDLLEKALHSVMFVVPTLKELQRLDLKRIKPSVKATASVKFDVASKEDLSIVEEIQKRCRIDIRAFNLDDRYGINVDRGIVFIGVNSKTEPFGMITENTEAIDLFVRQFIIEAWTRGRPINIRP
ncbi:MAG: hypothetical protein JW839_02445 [Candidatus Lokiarchaeota archaeon]|nr:hypothetical protein [Candidatus Lokiarchaeota archaeon]